MNLRNQKVKKYILWLKGKEPIFIFAEIVNLFLLIKLLKKLVSV